MGLTLPKNYENRCRTHFVQDLLDNPSHYPDEVILAGWAQFIRVHGQIIFIDFRDGTGIIQASVKKDTVGEQIFAELKALTPESTLILSGKLRIDNRAPHGVELAVDKASDIYPAEEWPIPKNAGAGFLFDNRHLHIRTERQRGIILLRSELMKTLREWLDKRRYVEINPPMIITAAVEGGATLFQVKYYNLEAYLTQSSQFYLEAFIPIFDHVFCLAPSFRADKSHTNRHLSEFWHLELEDAFTSLEGTMKIQENLVADVIGSMVNKHESLIKELGGDIPLLKGITPPFERITYTEAVEIIQKKGMRIDWGDDLGTESEAILTQDLEKPIFVTNYPRKVKAFYHLPDPQNDKLVRCADLLLPKGYGELIGGGQRIHDLQQLVEAMNSAGLNPKEYQWYVDLRKYGTQPHSGFGMGVDRFIRFLLNLPHIRESVAFPRTMTRVYP